MRPDVRIMWVMQSSTLSAALERTPVILQADPLGYQAGCRMPTTAPNDRGPSRIRVATKSEGPRSRETAPAPKRRSGDARHHSPGERMYERCEPPPPAPPPPLPSFPRPCLPAHASGAAGARGGAGRRPGGWRQGAVELPPQRVPRHQRHLRRPHVSPPLP